VERGVVIEAWGWLSLEVQQRPFGTLLRRHNSKAHARPQCFIK